jgi:hypothetical protein
MQKKKVFILILALCAISCVVTAQDVISGTEGAAAQVTVTDVEIDPEVFIRGDTGTIMVEVTNNGDVPINLGRALLRDNDITVMKESANYDSLGPIGAGNRMQFTFTVRADTPDGIYYPKFELQFREATSLRYRIPLRVESTELEVIVAGRPDEFSEMAKETITIAVGNPRENTVNGLSISAAGEGIEVTESGYFIGNLAPDQSEEVDFEISASQSSTLVVRVQYRNGINLHETLLSIPVSLTSGKIKAEPILNNIEIQAETGYYQVTGDVTNAGLDSAKSVLITTGAPAEPVDPYRVYVVGSLDTDDFSSFELTFKAARGEQVPLIIQYKDEDGNSFEERLLIDLDVAAAGEEEEGLDPVLIGVLLIVVIVIAGVIVYTWKKK